MFFCVMCLFRKECHRWLNRTSPRLKGEIEPGVDGSAGKSTQAQPDLDGIDRTGQVVLYIDKRWKQLEGTAGIQGYRLHKGDFTLYRVLFGIDHDGNVLDELIGRCTIQRQQAALEWIDLFQIIQRQIMGFELSFERTGNVIHHKIMRLHGI